ncbi:dTDP-4-dehydrorhamnose reductase [Aeromonas sp. S16(2024)]|uniref:dTDP-4-dehydrorhamnose reductase n=1 Tax=Aeromonas sp. S16(2024) TaxID=3242889 RepID=UPI003526F726
MSLIEQYSSFSSNPPLLLLLGGNGQLGQALCQLIDKRVLLLPERADVVLQHPETLTDLVTRLRPAVIINATAYTQVDRAETEPDVANSINQQAVAVLADAATRAGALLVHFSTDYVFDGSGDRPWREEDKPAPLNVYGLSKLQGERAILTSGCHHLILRTSWLHSPWRQNFIKTMLCLGQERESLFVVCDQIGAPTSATMLAKVTLEAIQQTLANPALCGLYHVTADGEVSWFDYARFIFAEARRLGSEFKLSELKPVQSNVYPVAARRPLNSRLDTAKCRAAFGIDLPDWRNGVRETLWQLIK